MIRVELDVNESESISKTTKNRFHNYVNITKEFIRNGQTSYGRSFHACFAVMHGRVLAVGFNDYRRRVNYIRGLGKIKHFDDPVSEYNMCLHSEIDALLKLGKVDYSSISFFNVHIDKNLHCKNSKPCPNCLYTLTQVGAKDIYYYDDKSKCFKRIKLQRSRGL